MAVPPSSSQRSARSISSNFSYGFLDAVVAEAERVRQSDADEPLTFPMRSENAQVVSYDDIDDLFSMDDRDIESSQLPVRRSRAKKLDYTVLAGLRPIESADSSHGSPDEMSPAFSPHLGRSPERVEAADDIATPPRVMPADQLEVEDADADLDVEAIKGWDRSQNASVRSSSQRGTSGCDRSERVTTPGDIDTTPRKPPSQHAHPAKWNSGTIFRRKPTSSKYDIEDSMASTSSSDTLHSGLFTTPTRNPVPNWLNAQPSQPNGSQASIEMFANQTPSDATARKSVEDIPTSPVVLRQSSRNRTTNRLSLDVGAEFRPSSSKRRPATMHISLPEDKEIEPSQGPVRESRAARLDYEVLADIRRRRRRPINTATVPEGKVREHTESAVKMRSVRGRAGTSKRLSTDSSHLLKQKRKSVNGSVGEVLELPENAKDLLEQPISSDELVSPSFSPYRIEVEVADDIPQRLTYDVIGDEQTRRSNCFESPNSVEYTNVEYLDADEAESVGNCVDPDVESSVYSLYDRDHVTIKLPPTSVKPSEQPAFVQPQRPPVTPVVRALTRQLARNNYDDTNEAQNELIWMERLSCTSELASSGRPMPKTAKLLMYQRQCEVVKLPPPISFEKLETMDWNYIEKIDDTQLLPGCRFKTADELNAIPRRHSKFPMCHPGPASGTWYYADSVVEQVQFVGVRETYYTVRWIGYEDVYNTVEPERNLKDQAIFILFKRPNIVPASQSSGPTLLRRSMRNMKEPVSTIMPTTIRHNDSFARAMLILDEHLAIEERAGRYLPSIGFYSLNIQDSLKYQLEFTKNVFHPILREVARPEYNLSENYLGSFFGRNRAGELEKLVEGLATTTPSIVRRQIFAGLKSSQFASFLVVTMRGGNQKATDTNLDMHMCVYTVRAIGDFKDSIFFDPAPPCHQRPIPDFLLKLREPKLRSASIQRGEYSTANDCLFQCFKYLIGLQTNQIDFVPNFNSKYFVLEK